MTVWSLVETTIKVVNYLDSVKNAKKEVEELKTELSGLYALYTHIKDVEERVKEFTSTTLNTWRSAIRSLGAENGPLAEYARTLATLSQKYGDRKSSWDSFRLRVTWISAKQDAQELLSKMGRAKLDISLLLNLDQIELLELNQKISEENQRINQANEESLRELKAAYQKDSEHDRLQDALNWISSNQFRSKQSDEKSLIQQQTNAWFLQTSEFIAWRDEPNQILYCPGIPGAGKTVMAATVIDHLETRIGYPAQAENLAYVFCDYKAQENQTETQLLGALVQQLVQNDPTLAQPLLTICEHHIERKTSPTAEDMFQLLLSLVNSQKVVYIIVDALDELTETGRKRSKLIEKLLRLQSHRSIIKLLFTSRSVPETDRTFAKAPRLEVRANPEDIKGYVTARLSQFQTRMSNGLDEKVISTIVSASNGM